MDAAADVLRLVNGFRTSQAVLRLMGITPTPSEASIVEGALAA